MASLKTKLVGGVALAAISGGSAFGAGFQVMEQSATAQGYSFAGATAAAEDISYMYFNPAAIAFHDGLNANGNFSFIFPSADVSNSTANTALGTPIGGGNAGTDELGIVPATYVSAQVSEQFFLGMSITSPFGLVTDYDDDWIGRYHATRSELISINVSPTIAFKPIPQVALAAGVVIEYVDASLGNAVDLGTAGAVNPAIGGAFTAVGQTPTPGGSDIDAEVHGDDIDFGFTLGALFEPFDGTRLGIGYRSEIEHEVDLQSQFSGTDAATGAVLAALQSGGVFTDGTASTVVSAPAQLNLGFYQELTDNFAVVGDARWTQWSSFDELVIEFDDGTPDSVTDESWDDTWFFGLGGIYNATDQLTLRSGVAFDQGAAPTETRTPRIPDANRWWFSVGATYALSDHMSLNAGYSFIRVDDAEIALEATGDNAGRGSLDADSEADVHIIAVGGSMKF